MTKDLYKYLIWSCILFGVRAKKWAWPDGNINDEQYGLGETRQHNRPNEVELVGEFPDASAQSLVGGYDNRFNNNAGPSRVDQYGQNIIFGPRSQETRNMLVGPGRLTGSTGPFRQPHNILLGPGGPTGIIGPYGNRPTGQYAESFRQRPVLVGPGGPTGIIGPGHAQRPNKGLLVGPDGPTGLIGPPPRSLLVVPDGPTGVIGPASHRRRHPQGTLVGPGGPTGIVGPGRYGTRGNYNRGVLVGPSGPTGIIGPAF